MYKVLQPATIGRLELRNRFVRSATGDSTGDPAGMVTDRTVELYERLAAGGVGLIITAHMFVTANGQVSVGQFGICGDELLPGLKRLVEVAHLHGAKIAGQISHAGLQSRYLSSQGVVTLAPSQLEGRPPHRAMADDEIEALIDAFTAAAVRAREAGFDAVQLHGAHGYLMSQFFSPTTNLRDDRWGGSPENRRRFHLETIRRVRAAVGTDYPLLMKFGVMDDLDGGATLDEGIAALAAMAEAGLDAVEISGGFATGPLSPIRTTKDAAKEDAYYRERAAKAKKAVGIPLILVGGMRTLETAEEIVTAGDADLISLCRPFIREPGLINRWLGGDHRRSACISCNKCLAIIYRGQPVECGEELRLREARQG